MFTRYAALKCRHLMKKWWSIPEEEQWTEHDLLPVIGMSIPKRLASYDLDNCAEINKAMDLIPKIIGFTRSNSDRTSVDEMEKKVLIGSSLKVLRRLTSTGGETGITLRHKISEDPCLLNNLAEILEDSSSGQELRELTIDIITKLAMDEDIRQEIGSIQVIFTKLMYAFLARDGPSNAHSNCSMPIKAGQALAMLTLESVDNCSAILKEPGVEFIKDLVRMLHEDRYRYMAASLLRNLCTHSRAELSDSDLGELSHALPEVLERVMEAERKELEVLVGISSQICSLISESFMQALEQGPNEARFVEKLVNALNANMKPSAQCPGVRRVVFEQSISMMELNSRYANQFRD